MPARHARPILVPLATLLLAGCGAAEYEARMKETQERLRRYDEESKLLGTPAGLPTARAEDGTEAAVAQFVIRLPAWVPPQPSKEAWMGMYYGYSSPPPKDQPVPAAMPWVGLAFAKADDANFPQESMKWFSATGPVNRSTVTTRLKVPFDRWTFENETTWYSVNLHKGSKQQVAVVVALPRSQAGQAGRAIDLSLDTFGFEGSLEAARKAYRPTGPLESVPR
ncbi:MAG: hypothetical protein ACRC33_13325 [Gemmataceae bacterium]